MQIRTTMRHHLTLVKSESLQIIDAAQGVEKKKPSCTVGGNASWCPLWDNSMEIPQKTENRATVWSGSPTPGHTSGGKHNSKRYMCPDIHSNTIHSRQYMESMSMCIERWVDKDMVCAHICLYIKVCIHMYVYKGVYTYVCI